MHNLEEHIKIGTDRHITVPESLKRIAVQYDHNVETVTFDCPRYWDGHDMSKMTVYINYMRKDRYRDKDLAENVMVDESNKDIMHFTWTVSRNATLYKGELRFLVCIVDLDDNANEKFHWNSELNNQMYVSEGLECEDAVKELHSDVITDLLLRMDKILVATTPILDKTLTESGLAADAKVTGDRIDEVERDLITASANLSGTISSKTEALKADVAVERARINKIIALEQGSTTGDAELVDIRVSSNGIVYDTAGDAVRTQFAARPNYHEVLRRRVGKNLFDKNAVTLGAFLNGTDKPVSNENSFYSDYIPIIGGESYSVNNTEGGGRYICFYDADYSIVEGGFSMESIVGVNTFVAPTNARFMRLSSYRSVINGLQIEKGNAVTEYEAYFEYEPIRNLENSIAESRKQYLKRVPSKNLFDKNAITSGYYLIGGGSLVANDGSFVSDFMPIIGGNTYSISDTSGGGRYICFYDDKDNPSLITGITMVSLAENNKTSFVAPEYANYMRISHFLRVVENLQIEEGSKNTTYEPYYEYKPLHSLEMNVNARLNALESISGATHPDYDQAASSISSNGTLALTDFPTHVKNGMAMSFHGEFDTFTTLLIGKGYMEYRGRWFEIDDENITLYGYENGTSIIKTVSHGLEIDSYVSVHISHKGEQYVVTVSSIHGGFTQTFDGAYDSNGIPFVTAGAPMRDCVFNATSDKLDKDVWLFGDSYFGLSSNRVIGQLRKLGYFDNILIDGLAGIGSSGSYTELIKCLKFGTPKTLIWCVGMNDSTDSYNNYIGQLLDVCSHKNIELILAKIPTVPERDKTGINKIVTESGSRYINFYKAVGTDDSGNWYDGYLDSDGVHPTELGAKALAMRMLIDAPEIMKH